VDEITEVESLARLKAEFGAVAVDSADSLLPKRLQLVDSPAHIGTLPHAPRCRTRSIDCVAVW
jgi:hypothetical protein